IISAQRTSEEILRNAHEQADTIVREAKVRAQEMMNELDGRIQKLNRETAEIEGRNALLRAKLRTVLNTYLSMLDEIPTGEPEVIKEVKKADSETKVIESETIRLDIKEDEA
ncbi:MAG: DivIVA domain-containing protein, partial [Clostridia bacterium]|nr:DivIVA domain-containing protein [Clostridia bacterium]